MQHLLVINRGERSDRLASELRRCGFEVDCQNILPAYDFNFFDLVLVDLETEVINSLEIVRTVRAQTNTPLVVLSTSEGVAECVVALEVGADDYIRRPVAELELAARIKALLRRSAANHAPTSNGVFAAGDIELYSHARIVKQRGERVNLTPVEFDLLKILLSSLGTLVTREAISREVFRRRPSSCNRAIDVHMSGLRKKLGFRGDGAERIRTIRGYGYIYTNGTT